ncbi:MAG TPA: polysaccharide deacetylase family protein [Polyangia bacterium]|nr:polysaccharide deacetylase family protein [Polyangia bacterium]
MTAPASARPASLSPALCAAVAAWLFCFSGCGKDSSTGAGTGGMKGGTGTGGAASGSGGASGGGGSGGVGNTGSGGSVGSGGTVPQGGSGGAVDGGKDPVDAPAGVDVGGTGGSAVALPGNGCAGGTCLNPTCTALNAPAAIGTFASIGFEVTPVYIPRDVIIPTFDDVPDRPWTAADVEQFANFGAGDSTRKLLEFADANNLHFDFFINTSNFCDVSNTPGCKAVLQGLLKTQNVGNHSVHHSHMGGDQVFNPADYAASSCGFTAASRIVCEDELKGVETLVSALSGGARPHLTRFRTPYGEPFQAGMPRLAEMSALAAKYAVHIGWQMDSDDSNHDTEHLAGQVFANNIIKAIGAAPGGGSRGVILMHGVFPWSVEAAKLLFDPNTGYLKTHGFRMGTVEDAVCWKYGKHSWEIIQQLSGQKRDPN